MGYPEQLLQNVQDKKLKSKLQDILSKKNISDEKFEKLKKVNFNHFQKFLPPEPLSREEIQDIISVLKAPPSLVKEISEENTESLKSKIAKQLSKAKIIKSSIPKLKEILYETFLRSLISPGEPSGINVATSVSEPLTQMGLDALHRSGKASNLGSSMSHFYELSEVKKERKNNAISVVFNERDITREEILERSTFLLGVDLEKLLLANKKEFRETPIPKEDEWWYTLYSQVFNEETPKTKNFLRLRLNVSKCYAYGITMEDIVNENVLLRSKNNVKVVASPLSVGIIDIYPDERKIYDVVERFRTTGKKLDICTNIKTRTKEVSESVYMNEEDRNILFLKTIFSTCLGDILIKGIKGARNISVIEQPLTIWMEEERPDYETFSEIQDKFKISNDEYFYTWLCKLNPFSINLSGIPSEKFDDLFRECKIKVLEKVESEDEILYTLFVNSRDETLKSYINKLLKVEKEKLIDEVEETIKDNSKNKDYNIPKYSNLYRYGYHCKADIYGKGIVQKLLNHPFINSKYVFPNNPNDIAMLYGIDAARLMMLREYDKIFKDNDSEINPLTLDLLVEYQTSMGALIPMTSNGASRRGNSTLAKLSFQDVMDSLKKASSMGKNDPVKGVSACLLTGTEVEIGTGYVKVDFDPDDLGKEDVAYFKRPSVRNSKRRFKGEDVVYKKINYNEFHDEKGVVYQGEEDDNEETNDVIYSPRFDKGETEFKFASLKSGSVKEKKPERVKSKKQQEKELDDILQDLGIEDFDEEIEL